MIYTCVALIWGNAFPPSSSKHVSSKKKKKGTSGCRSLACRHLRRHVFFFIGRHNSLEIQSCSLPFTNLHRRKFDELVLVLESQPYVLLTPMLSSSYKGIPNPVTTKSFSLVRLKAAMLAYETYKYFQLIWFNCSLSLRDPLLCLVSVKSCRRPDDRHHAAGGGGRTAKDR